MLATGPAGASSTVVGGTPSATVPPAPPGAPAPPPRPPGGHDWSLQAASVADSRPHPTRTTVSDTPNGETDGRTGWRPSREGNFRMWRPRMVAKLKLLQWRALDAREGCSDRSVTCVPIGDGKGRFPTESRFDVRYIRRRDAVTAC